MLKAVGSAFTRDGVYVGVVSKHSSEKAKFELRSQKGIGVK